jgi:two-component system sensor histidine kinase QseC
VKSIRTRLIVYLVAGVTLLQIAAGAGLFGYVHETLEHSLDAALLAKADSIANAVHMEDDHQPHLLTDTANFSEPAHHDGPFYFEIWRNNGIALVRMAPPESGSTDLPKFDSAHKQFANITLARGISARATQRAFFAQPDEDQYDPGHHQPIPRGEAMTLIVAHDRRSIDQTLAVLLTGLAATISLVTAGIVAIVTWGVRRGLRPLQSLGNEVACIGPTTLRLRCTSTNLPAEIQPIATKLNALLDRLQEAFYRERRFSGDVAHELRTPLAELRSLCEVTLKWPDDRANASAVIETLQITKQMEATVDSLLSLIRVQAGIQVPQTQDVDASQLVDNAWAALKESAHGKELRIEQRSNGSHHVQTDRLMLSQIIGNLLRNAVQHAPVGGELVIETLSQNNEVTVAVGNTNTALKLEDIRHLRESFWRKDSSRCDQMSTGLGLAIADEYCRCLGVKLDLALTKDDWFQAVLKVPTQRR